MSLHSFGTDPISCYAWNKDGQHYKQACDAAGINWAPNSSNDLTSTMDPNAYVGSLRDQGWTPTLVLLGINRVASYVEWSPQENKLALGNRSKIISACFFGKENDSKHVKKSVKSTILSREWHPNNILLAAESSNFQRRVFSASVKEIEDKPGPMVCGSKMPFSKLLFEKGDPRGRIHAVCVSPTGQHLLWVSHHSTIPTAKAAKSKTGQFSGSLQHKVNRFALGIWRTQAKHPSQR
uniref:Actin related protein 2/3 complex subunit 1A n=1 Tax=Crocodylus porosus TaxID=8502 RepID=A0A7M4FNX2_CROPO